MNDNESLDDDKPFEERPGYLGLVLDDFVDFAAGIAALEGFDFGLYGEMASELNEVQRSLRVRFDETYFNVMLDAGDVIETVEALPLVSTHIDCDPDQGPAGGSAYVFLLCDNGSVETCARHAQILRAALDRDFEKMRARVEVAST